MSKSYFFLFCLVAVPLFVLNGQEKDPFGGFDLPEEKSPVRPKEASEKEKRIFEDFELPEEKKQKEQQDLFSAFVLPEERKAPQEEKGLFKAFVLPEERPKSTSPTKPPPPEKTDLLQQIEKKGEEWLVFFNPYHWYRKARGERKIVERPKEERVPLPVFDPMKEKGLAGKLEKELLQAERPVLDIVNQLERLSLEEPTGQDPSPEVQYGALSLPDLPELKTEIPVPAKVEGKAEVPWAKFAFTHDVTFFDLSGSLFNPNNVLDYEHRLNRSLLRSTLSFTIYDNEDYNAPLVLSFYLKDTWVYLERTYAQNQDFFDNSLQEAYLSLQYHRFNLDVGKINVRPGEGGGYAWKPTDIFQFDSPIFHPKDGNFQRRGIRPGLYGIQSGYSFPFGTFSFFYSPDLTDHGDVRGEKSELRNNRENIVYGKFSWMVFSHSPTSLFVPESPEFIVSYLDRQKKFNAGIVWSLGIGSNLLFRVESNYSTKTDMLEIRERDPIAGYRQFEIERRDGWNWQSVLSMTWTVSQFNIDMEYYFNLKGMSRNEMNRFFDRAQFLSDHYRDPVFGEMYFGLLAQAAAFDSSSLGKHYLFSRISRTFLVGAKSRSLEVQISNVIQLQDYSGGASASMKYQFFTYAQFEASVTAVYGKKRTAFGESPFDSFFTMSLEILF